MSESAPELRAGPGSLSDPLRFLLFVVLPAAGWVAGAVAATAAAPWDRVEPHEVLLRPLVGGHLGAWLLLVVGVSSLPWLPRRAPGAPPGTASLPDRRSWQGVALVALLALGIGLPAGVRLVGANRAFYGALQRGFTGPARVVVVVAAALIALLLLHPRRGPGPADRPRPPLHPVVLGGLLRALLAGLAGAAAMLVPGLLHGGDPLPLTVMGLAFGGSAAALLATAEEATRRVPARWRWPVLLGGGGLVPVLVYLLAGFTHHMYLELDPIQAPARAVAELLEVLARRPAEAVGVVLVVAAPLAMLGSARIGLLPCLGQPRPWPLPLLLPLGWLAAALIVALAHLCLERLSLRELPAVVDCFGALVPALLVSMHVAGPLEGWLARRWLLLTGGGN